VAPEPRAGLGVRKSRRPHPASPDAVAEADARSAAQPGHVTGEGELVMLCVRVAPALRRRLKLAAARTGRPVQALAAEALEAWCRRYDM
jgi:predicted HicB family RNase H-like nuclease